MKRASAGKRFYVVWVGRKPGVYGAWDQCREQVERFPGAEYKAFRSLAEAAAAYGSGIRRLPSPTPQMQYSRDGLALAVDGACSYSGDTGVGECRGVIVPSKQEVFRLGPYEKTTNNAMEYLGIVQGMRWMLGANLRMPIYTDSETAMGWVRDDGMCKTTKQLPPGSKLERDIRDAEAWVARAGSEFVEVRALLRKWDTRKWGENPADFGRK
jgi:ribonuclease HI